MSKLLLAGWLITGGADAATTHLALGLGAPEQNPLFAPVPKPAIPYAVILGDVSCAAIDWRAARKHPTLAKWVALVAITSNTAMAVRNYKHYADGRSVLAARQ